MKFYWEIFSRLFSGICENLNVMEENWWSDVISSLRQIFSAKEKSSSISLLQGWSVILKIEQPLSKIEQNHWASFSKAKSLSKIICKSINHWKGEICVTNDAWFRFLPSSFSYSLSASTSSKVEIYSQNWAKFSKAGFGFLPLFLLEMVSFTPKVRYWVH